MSKNHNPNNASKQLSMFDDNEYPAVSNILPEPLKIADKWKFPLAYIDQDGKPEHFLYHAVQWTQGLGAEGRQTWTNLKSRLYKSNVQLNIHQIPYVSDDDKTYQVDFIDEKTCYETAMSMRLTQSRPQLVEIRAYLKVAGVVIGVIERNPEKADDLKIAMWRRQGKSEEWIRERIEGKQVRSEIAATWQQRGAKGVDFAVLTNEINSVALGQSATKMTHDLQIKPGQLRNHLDESELGVIRVTESASNTLHNLNNSQGTSELKEDITATNPIAEIARKVFGASRRK